MLLKKLWLSSEPKLRTIFTKHYLLSTSASYLIISPDSFQEIFSADLLL